jgi:serine/threonine-protein kinase HipA
MTRRAPVFRWMFEDELLQRRTPVRVGELTQEATRWEFVYDPDYLALGVQAWELDPADIRTKQRSAYTTVGVVPPPVFCDIAVSGWAKEILRKKANVLFGDKPPLHSGEPWGWWERLIYAPADGFGALFVGELDDKPQVERVLADAISLGLTDALQAALLESSSGSMGGERPKFTGFRLHDQQAGATPVILKFAHPSERSDSVVAEATALSLAQALGLTVPEHGIEWLNGSAALRITRFDRGPNMIGPVFHCVSAATALRIQPGTDVEDPRRSYVALRSKLRQPGDALELYRRVVLNAAVGNGDDHPWNTSMRQTGLGNWELSPLYDVMPFFKRSNPTAFAMAIRREGTRLGSLPNLLAAGREIAGLAPTQAKAVIEEIFDHVRTHWQTIFEGHSQQLPDARPEDWSGVFAPTKSQPA